MDDNSAVTLDMLKVIERNPEASQRSMASELGIAVGLTNAYIKRCVTKGLVKMSQAPAGRYLYYLTPQGFAEKARLSAEFLSQSFSLIRQARHDYSIILSDCRDQGIGSVLLAGASDLVEVVQVYAADNGIAVMGIVDPVLAGTMMGTLAVRARVGDFQSFDAIVLTDLSNPQLCCERIASQQRGATILVPPLFALKPSVPPAPQAPTVKA